MHCRECLGPIDEAMGVAKEGPGEGAYGGGQAPGAGGAGPESASIGGSQRSGVPSERSGAASQRSGVPSQRSGVPSQQSGVPGGADTISNASQGSSKPPPFEMNYLPSGDADEPLPAEVEDPFCQENNPRVVRFEEITKASYIIKSGVYLTPCVPSHLPGLTGMDIYLKKDFLQHTGNFKERGARNVMLMLSDDQKRRGVISASAGNHAQAMCYHGRLLGVPVTVVMPVISSIMKIQNCRNFGATVVVKGQNMMEAKLWAMHIGKQNGLMYINGYDHPQVLAGAGTVGLEIVEQVPDLDAVVVPTGGGGLLAGVCVAVKYMKPAVKVIGVEPTNCASFAAAMEAGRPVAAPCTATIAEGLAVGKVGVNAYATAAPLVDKMVAVPESALAIAILRLAEMEKCVVEGAGASGLAAVLSGQLEELRGKKVVLILSGGNIDSTVFGRVLDRGLAADNRLIKFTIPLVDRPGGLQELCHLLAGMGVSIKDLEFERAWMKDDVFKMKAHVVCETRDAVHSNEVQQALKEKFQLVIFGDTPFPGE